MPFVANPRLNNPTGFSKNDRKSSRLNVISFNRFTMLIKFAGINISTYTVSPDYRYPTDVGIPIQVSHIQPSLRDSNLRLK